MKCLLLGTGGSVNTRKRHNTSLLLTTNESAVMVDCNGNATRQLDICNHDYSGLKHIFFTHEHIDHIAAINNFLHQLWVRACLYCKPDARRKEGINLYGNARTLATIDTLLTATKMREHPHMFPVNLIELPYDGGQIDCDGIKIIFFPVNHGATPCFSLETRIESGNGLVYSADTELDDNVFNRLQSNDILIHDCNKYDQKHNPEHTTWLELKTALVTKKYLKTILVHLPIMNDEQELAFAQDLYISFGEHVVLGYDGMEFVIE